MKIYNNSQSAKKLRTLKSAIGKDLWIKCLIPGHNLRYGFYWVMPKSISEDYYDYDEDIIVTLSYLDPFFYFEGAIDNAMHSEVQIPFNNITIVDPIDVRATGELREEIRRL